MLVDAQGSQDFEFREDFGNAEANLRFLRDIPAHARRTRSRAPRRRAPGARSVRPVSAPDTEHVDEHRVRDDRRWWSFTPWRPDHCTLHTYTQLSRRLERHGFQVEFHDVAVEATKHT